MNTKHIILFLATSTFLIFHISTAQIYFDDSSPDTIICGNSIYYEIGLSKQHGAILYITDNQTFINKVIIPENYTSILYGEKMNYNLLLS